MSAGERRAYAPRSDVLTPAQAARVAEERERCWREVEAWERTRGRAAARAAARVGDCGGQGRQAGPAQGSSSPGPRLVSSGISRRGARGGLPRGEAPASRPVLSRAERTRRGQLIARQRERQAHRESFEAACLRAHRNQHYSETVRNCPGNPYARHFPWVVTWSRAEPAAKRVRPAYCGSAHCPACAGHWSDQTMARAMQGYRRNGFGAADVVNLVLTLPPHQHERLAARVTTQARLIDMMHRQLATLLKTVKRWVRKRWGATVEVRDGAGEVVRRAVLLYLRTTEQHASGVPHINVPIVCRPLAEWVSERAEKAYQAGHPRDDCRIVGVVSKRWASWLHRYGFGEVSTIERNRQRDGVEELFGYSFKTSERKQRVGRMMAEVAKTSQTPQEPGFHQRLFSSSPGLLEPRRKGDGTRAGGIVTRFRSGAGVVVVSARQADAFAARLAALSDDDRLAPGRAEALLCRTDPEELARMAELRRAAALLGELEAAGRGPGLQYGTYSLGGDGAVWQHERKRGKPETTETVVPGRLARLLCALLPHDERRLGPGRAEQFAALGEEGAAVVLAELARDGPEPGERGPPAPQVAAPREARHPVQLRLA